MANLASVERRAVEIETARRVSLSLTRPGATAWVYLLTRSGGDPGLYITRFSDEPEATIADEPGSRLAMIAGFREGFCVQSAEPSVIEIERGSCQFCGGDLSARLGGGRQCDDCGELFF
jgi:hypothetical protein